MRKKEKSSVLSQRRKKSRPYNIKERGKRKSWSYNIKEGRKKRKIGRIISRRGEKRENGHIILEGKSHHLTAGQDWIRLEVGPTSSLGHRDILFALLYSDGRVWVANCIRDDDGETS